MALNKQSGNMYNWCNYTWNAIKGKCPHNCDYCYMKRFKVGKLRLDKKCLKDNLGEGRIIFVGSSTDMWAKEVPDKWIETVLNRCRFFHKNTYLFQSKNPIRFKGFLFPPKTILGTTIEYNYIDSNITEAPNTSQRADWMCNYPSFDKMISIEPIMDFRLLPFVRMIKQISPKFISIGADSQGHNLPEPSPEKVKALINELKKFTEVRIKPNLNRIIGGGSE